MNYSTVDYERIASSRPINSTAARTVHRPIVDHYADDEGAAKKRMASMVRAMIDLKNGKDIQ